MSERSSDVCVIGGGIIGASAACFLAEAGASVVLIERQGLAAAASGRNSGSVQHPFDPPLARLHAATLGLYRDLAGHDPQFQLPPVPAGILLLSPEEVALRSAAASIARRAPELQPRVLTSAEARRLEPCLAPGLAACRLETGYPVAPAAATLAFARRAQRAGAEIRTGEAASPLFSGDRVIGVRLESGAFLPAGQVLVAAGPWTPAIVAGWAADPPIRSVWGVVLSVALESPPGHMLEELGIDTPARTSPALFSLITSGGASSVGSTFLDDRPDPLAMAPLMLDRAAGFVPDLRRARPTATRACARPVSFDGRPIVGRVDGHDGLFVCAGHGPWGISIGPASAAMVSREMVGGAAPGAAAALPPALEMPELSPLRVARRPV